MKGHIEGSTTTKTRTPINKIHILLICRTYNYVQNVLQHQVATESLQEST